MICHVVSCYLVNNIDVKRNVMKALANYVKNVFSKNVAAKKQNARLNASKLTQPIKLGSATEPAEK